MKSIDQCADKNRAKGEAEMMVACLPFSSLLKTSGIWVVGFEKNDFFEGGPPPPPEIMWRQGTGADLIVDEKLFHPTPDVQAYQVDVVGRRALCPMGAINPYPIAVESLAIRKRLGRMPS